MIQSMGQESIRADRNLFQRIFAEHWESFLQEHPEYDREYYQEVVGKMLGCGDVASGYIGYVCPECSKGGRKIAFSCKSSFCLRCAKVYVDDWVSQVSKMLHPGVLYRHVVLTVPDVLRGYFVSNDKDFLGAFMRAGYECLGDLLSLVKRQPLKVGTIVVLQTAGRSSEYNPHLHIIMPAGGINKQSGKWVTLGYFPYELLHKKWEYHLFRMIENQIDTPQIRGEMARHWKQYPNGLVAYIEKGRVPEKAQGLARYLAKYVVSPPMAISRIIEYAGDEVTYWYQDHKTKQKQVAKVSVFEFIRRMVQHILPKWFHRIRYYGLQSTKAFEKVKVEVRTALAKIGKIIKGTYRIVANKSYRERYREGSGRDPLVCEHCGAELILEKIWHPKYGLIYDLLKGYA